MSRALNSFSVTLSNLALNAENKLLERVVSSRSQIGNCTGSFDRSSDACCAPWKRKNKTVCTKILKVKIQVNIEMEAATEKCGCKVIFINFWLQIKLTTYVCVAALIWYIEQSKEHIIDLHGSSIFRPDNSSICFTFCGRKFFILCAAFFRCHSCRWM